MPARGIFNLLDFAGNYFIPITKNINLTGIYPMRVVSLLSDAANVSHRCEYRYEKFFKTMREIKKTKTAGMLVMFCAAAIIFGACTNFGGDSAETSSARQDSATSKSSAAGNPAEKPGVNEVQIVIENFAFVPSEITIAPGTKVTWINKDEAPHTATSTDKKFASAGLDTDDKYSFVFNDKGEFPYFCALHPHMTASITVK